MNQAKPKIFLRKTLSICDRRHPAPRWRTPWRLLGVLCQPLGGCLTCRAAPPTAAPPQECSPSGDCLRRGLVNGPASPQGWPRLWWRLDRAHLLPPFHRVDPRGTSASAPCLLTDCSCFPENPPPTEAGGELTTPLESQSPDCPYSVQDHGRPRAASGVGGQWGHAVESFSS